MGSTGGSMSLWQPKAGGSISLSYPLNTKRRKRNMADYRHGYLGSGIPWAGLDELYPIHVPEEKNMVSKRSLMFR